MAMTHCCSVSTTAHSTRFAFPSAKKTSWLLILHKSKNTNREGWLHSGKDGRGLATHSFVDLSKDESQVTGHFGLGFDRDSISFVLVRESKSAAHRKRGLKFTEFVPEQKEEDVSKMSGHPISEDEVPTERPTEL